MNALNTNIIRIFLVGCGLFLCAVLSSAQEKRESSYSPVIEEPFEKVMARLWLPGGYPLLSFQKSDN